MCVCVCVCVCYPAKFRGDRSNTNLRNVRLQSSRQLQSRDIYTAAVRMCMVHDHTRSFSDSTNAEDSPA